MNNTKELVFIDESLVELDVLLKSISNKTIFLLNHKTPLLSQMAQKLQDNKDIKAIHIITHGNSGELLLGDYVVSTTTLPLYSKEILTISDAMLEDGEIFLYGCEVAYGEKGEEFVTTFADFTNKKVAAASHKVGHTQFDASWELDMMPNIMMAQPLMVNEWRGVLAAPVNGVYTFANATDNKDGTYTTEDGFFLISAVNGEYDTITDDLVVADEFGVYVNSGGGPYSGATNNPVGPASPTSYLEIKPAATGSFILNGAVIGEISNSTAVDDSDYTNIYVVGYANGVEVARTAAHSSVGSLDAEYTFANDFFTPFADKQIDTIRIYFDTPTGDLADRLTLINMDISGASTDAAPSIPVVNFNYTDGGDFWTVNSANGNASELSLGNTTSIPNANVLFGAGIDDGTFTGVYQIGGSSGISSFNTQTDGKLEYLAINSYNNAVSLRQFKVYNDSSSDITLTITGHALGSGVFDSNLTVNPAVKTTTALAVHGQWTTINLPADFGEYKGFRIDSGSNTETVPLYFNGFAMETTPPPPPPPPPPPAPVEIVLDLDQVGEGNVNTNNSTGIFDWYVPVYIADSGAVLGENAPTEYKNLIISVDTTGWNEDSLTGFGVSYEQIDDIDDLEDKVLLSGDVDGTSRVFDPYEYGGSTEINVQVSGTLGEGVMTLTFTNDEGGNITKEDLNILMQNMFFYEDGEKFSDTRVFNISVTDADDNVSDISTFSVTWAPDTEAPYFDGFGNYDDFVAPIAADYFTPDNGNYISFYMDDDVTAVANKFIKLWKVVEDGDDVVVGSYEVTDTDAVEIDGGQISFYPNLDTSLESGTSYYFTIDAGAFLDAALNEFEGFDALIDNEWSFSTAFPSLGTWNVADADPDSDGIQPTVSSTGAFRGNLEISANGKYVVMAEEVAYKESISSSSGVSVKMINPNGSWSYVGENAFASTSTSGGLYDLVVATDGETDTLYTVSVSNDNANAGPNTISTHMFKDGAWVQVGTNLSDNVGPFVSNFNIVMQPPKVVLLDGGIMMVAYSTNVGGVPKVEVKYGFLEQFEAEPLDATWQAAGTPIDPTTVKDAFDLIAVGGEFLLGIASANSQDVKFYIPNGEGGWVDNMIPTLSMAQMSGDSSQGATLKMAVDGNGVIYAVYGKNDSGLTDIAVSKFDITAATPAWVDLPAPADAKLSINEGGMRVDLVFDAENVPHLSLVGDGNVVDVYRFDEVNSNWRELDTGSSLDSIDSLPMADLEIHDGELSMLISKYGNELGMYLAEFEPSVDDTPDNSSVTLDVANPFTPENDTTAITIDAPDGVTISDASNSAVTGLPKNVKMPLGQFGFTLSGLENGATVQMSMTADADFKQFSYFKQNLVTGKWVNIMEGVTINDNGGTATVKFSLTDGGVYDADRIANGVIVDPGGVGENALLPMISENTIEVGNVSLLDDDAATGTISYAITGGADAAKFTISATTGLLSFNSEPDYESPTDAGDTAANNTYAVQVTLTGSTSGTEVQNLIVSVLNVAEDSDNPNTAPLIVGLRAEAQEVTAGTSVALDDIRVVDANSDTMTVTLTALNGTIGGLTDADANTAGIQLTGTATAINMALASATFTATAAGEASVNLSVTDNAQSGTAITTTSVYNLSASAAPTPPSGGGDLTPTPPTTTIDGATVQTGTTTETRTTTDSNGNTITTTVTTEQLVISPVGDNRTDSTGTATTADIPLFWGESGRTEWATTASLPTGFGLTTSGSRAPSQTATQQSVLADLIYYIDTTAPSTDLNKTQMLSGGSSFLSALGNIETLVVNKVTLTSSTTLASNTPITISGTTNGIVTTTGTQAPQEALVIDASSLPINTIIELENVEFAVIVGNNITIRGGDGQNTLFSGDGSQDIMLGADDDELHAGAGDDKVGSAGGNDKIFGESGNDTVFGGEGNDMLHGGSDIDVATYSGNISDYVITRDESKTYVALASNSQEKDTLINVESIKFADTNYVIETTVKQSQIATLYMQVLDRQAEIDGYQYWAYSGNELGAMAINFVKSEEYKIKSGVNWDSLNIEDKIETLYEAILGRNSDAQGKQNWIDYYNSGATIEQVAEGFVDSIELSGIYQNKEDWNFTL